MSEDETTLVHHELTRMLVVEANREDQVLGETVTFGEFLVERGGITRYQLFRALQMQDRNPRARIGECIVALGFLPTEELQRQLSFWVEGQDRVRMV
jgi:hypothetical protein